MIYVIERISRTARYADRKTLKVDLVDIWSGEKVVAIVQLPLEFITSIIYECRDNFVHEHGTYRTDGLVHDTTQITDQLKDLMIKYADNILLSEIDII